MSENKISKLEIMNYKPGKWQEAAKEGALRKAIVQLIQEYDYVSWEELTRALEQFFDISGDHCLSTAESNVIFWVGMSEAFIDTIIQMILGEEIYLHPCSDLVYLADGRFLNISTAQRIPAKGYKKPHWFPTVFRLVPPQESLWIKNS